MSINATQNSTDIKTPDEGHCPAWCVRHERYDVGHRDEGVTHIGRRRQFSHQTFELRQDHMLRKRPGRTSLWFNDEEMTPAQARQLSQTITDVIGTAV